MTIPGAWVRAARGANLLSPDGSTSPTIFAEMSALALATGAINLGQGFPDEDGPREVLDAAVEAIRAGINQYPPGLGTAELRNSVARHQRRFYGLEVDPETETLITAGATEALAATLIGLLDEGDEIVTLEPFYDAYGALIGLAKAVPRTVALRAPDFQPDHDELRAAVNDRTRVILINSPHNPTGAVLTRETLELVVQLAREHDAIIVTDEVYEHLTFGVPHIPVATLPGARERTVSISSGGKTFNTTGWKIGWLTAPRELVSAILAVKQFLTYVNGAPFQPAIAAGLDLPDAFFARIAAELKGKRDLLTAGLDNAGFTTFVPQGGYFVIADAAPLGVEDGAAYCRRLPALAGVVAVPVSAFCGPEHAKEMSSLIRFAYCKRVGLLERAADQLSRLRAAL